MLMLFAMGYLFVKGVGIWGVNIPIGWGFAIVNFVWWIGIGHAGTLISAILALLRQSWRNSINRFAEAMTLFAVACAGYVPAAAHWPSVAGVLAVSLSEHHELLAAVPQPTGLGRVCGLDLRHDFAAVLVHWTDSRSSDVARPAQKSVRQAIIYGLLAMGWRGSARHWARYETAYLLLAGLATPLVLSVHTVVSFDFAIGIVPGWHTTIFPPYFVAGAIYSGFAMVLMLAIPIRKFYGAGRFHYRTASGKLRQGHAGDRPDRRLRICHRSIHGLVRRQSATTRSCSGTGCMGLMLRGIGAALLAILSCRRCLWIQKIPYQSGLGCS